MASFLDKMASSIYAGFKGKLRSGLIVRNLGGGLDDHGRPSGAIPTATTIQGFPDDYSDFIRATAGIPATDLTINIFGASMPGNRPLKDDKVRLDFPAANGSPARSQWYQLRAARTDPASALWVCRAFEIPDGPDNYEIDLAALIEALSRVVNEPGEDG